MDKPLVLSTLVIDKERILNNGKPMSLTSIEGSVATVEYFEGEDAIHKVEKIDVNRLKSL